MPQVKKAIHWTQVLFELRENTEKGKMFERDMAAAYDITPAHEDFKHAVAICLKQRKIDRALGLTKGKKVGILLTLTEHDDTTIDGPRGEQE